MYPSDYGYATSGGSTTNREACLNIVLSNWDVDDICSNNDLIFDRLNGQWTLTSFSTDSFRAFYVTSYGDVGSRAVNGKDGIFPALYLISNVKISGGSGSSNDPYRLEI